MSPRAQLLAGTILALTASCATSSAGDPDAGDALAPSPDGGGVGDAGSASAPVVITPNGGEEWRPDTTESIVWSDDGNIANVDITLWKAGLLSLTIATDVANAGSYDWTMPAGIARAADYRVRIIDSANPGRFDESDADFAIDDRSLTLTAPNGSEELTAGETTMITWTSEGNLTGVDIELHRAGVWLADVATGIADSGAHSWLIDPTVAAGDDYSIVIHDADQATPNDSSDATFALRNWRFRLPIVVTPTTSRSNFPLVIELDAASFAYTQARSDGGDLRFATTANRAAGFDLPYFVDDWVYNGDSRIWVLVPSLPAATATTIYMFYGQSEASTTSDAMAALPVRFTSSGSEALTGDIEVDVFTVQAGHTVTVAPGTTLSVTARIVEVLGTIDGDGAGASGGGTAGGSGPGAGGGSTDSGAGGGGYGGRGGTGGYDSGDSPGTSGPINGDAGSIAIAMGSGGGGPSDMDGGAGGGAVTLRGFDVTISGTIDVDGGAGQYGSTTGRGSGGGSGGGILVVGHDVVASGSLTGDGGNGGTNTSTSSDGGGGGGGGRIKIFHAGALSNSGTLSVGGGAGGTYGDVSSGENGLPGTTRVDTTTSTEPSLVFAPVEAVY